MIGVETKAVAGLLVSSHSSGDLGLKPAQSGDAFFAVHDFSAGGESRHLSQALRQRSWAVCDSRLP